MFRQTTPDIKTDLDKTVWNNATLVLSGVHTGDGSKTLLWKNCTAKYKKPGDGADVNWTDTGISTGQWTMPSGWKAYVTYGEIRVAT